MQIKISLPSPNDHSISTYSEINGYLKQLELAVHHAQKAVESYKKDTGVEEISEDSWVAFSLSRLSESVKECAIEAINKGGSDFLENLAEEGLDDYYGEKQFIDLIIELEPKKLEK